MIVLQDRKAAVAQPVLRPMEFDDYQAVERLEASEGLLTLAERDWRALWLENPLWEAVRDHWSIGWVLECDDAVVGAVSNIPSRYVLAGRTLIAAAGRAWVVAPSYRGFALWLLDEFFNQDADLLFNTTVNGLADETFHVFGSARPPRGDWERAAFRVTRHAAFATAALRIKHVPLANLLGPAAGALLRVKDAVFAPRTAGPPEGWSLDWADGFDSRFDTFWHELIRANPATLLGGRSRAELAWHFGGASRAGGLWVGTLTRGDGALRGYGVFKRQDHAPSGLTRMRLVDYQTIETAIDLLPSLVGAAARRCAVEGVAVLEHVGCDLPKTRAFDRLAPYRRDLPAWSYYYKAIDPALEVALTNPDAWAPSSFDGDASL